MASDNSVTCMSLLLAADGASIVLSAPYSKSMVWNFGALGLCNAGDVMVGSALNYVACATPSWNECK